MTAHNMTAAELEKLLADAGPAMDGMHRISADDWGVDMPGDGGWVFVGKRENAPRLIVIETGFGSSADRRLDAIERLCILAPTLARRVIAAERMCDLLKQGECPWREDTSNYREWWAERKEAATTYRDASK